MIKVHTKDIEINSEYIEHTKEKCHDCIVEYTNPAEAKYKVDKKLLCIEHAHRIGVDTFQDVLLED